MPGKKVYVTRIIPNEAIELLKEHFDVDINMEDRVLTRDELAEKIRHVDGVLCTLVDKIDTDIMNAAGDVKVYANNAVGYNNIDIGEAAKRGIIVTNTPGVLTDTTADLAWTLLCTAARRVVEADRYTREGKFKAWSPSLFLGQDISGKVLGIIGAGRIGKALAKRSTGFDMRVIYHNRSRDEEFEEKYNAKWVDMDILLEESDFISIHVPLTRETTHMIGEREFGKMKKTAVLINTARGPVVDEKALVNALETGKIWAAGLDVYENEPEVEEGLKKLDNAVILPHIGSASVETRTKMAVMAAENIISVLQGKGPINSVNS